MNQEYENLVFRVASRLATELQPELKTTLQHDRIRNNRKALIDSAISHTHICRCQNYLPKLYYGHDSTCVITNATTQALSIMLIESTD